MNDIKEKLKKYLLSNKYSIQNEPNDNLICSKYPIIINLFENKIEIKDLSDNRKFIFDYENISLIKKFILYLDKNLVIL